MVSCVGGGNPLLAATHAGSAFIRMGALAGGVPSKLILPATVTAVAGSTAAAGASADSGLVDGAGSEPPPHAATPKVSTKNTARSLRCIETLLDVETTPK